MTNEPTSKKLLRYLDASVGRHCHIAKSAGVAQATISRIYLRKGTTTIQTAELLVAWFEAEAEAKSKSKLAPGLPHAKRVRVRRAGSAAATAVA